MEGKPICMFFQKGFCKKGNSCTFSHSSSSMEQTPDTNTIPKKYEYETRICPYFLEGNCKNPKCNSIHAYSQKLDHVIFDEEFKSKAIVGMCQINSSKFAIADENSISIWEITDTKKLIGNQEFSGEKIKKILYSNGKIILISSIEKMLTSDPIIHIISDDFFLGNNLKSLKSLNDVIEVDNYILGVGDNIIQSLTIEQGAISLGPFSINDLDKSEIICINFHPALNIFFCGHMSGNISAWNISSDSKFLKCIANSKIHDDSINFITFKNNFLITCSSDNTIKVFNLDNNFENVMTKNFESPVMNFSFTKNAENLECFVISLANGNVLITDQNFEILIKIPSMKNSSQRFSINVSNKLMNENDGNFLLISDGNAVNVNMWVKNVANSLKNINARKTAPKQDNFRRENFQSHHNPHQNQHFMSQNNNQNNVPRGNFQSYRGRGNFPRGGYQGNNRFDNNESSFSHNFSSGQRR